MARNVALLGPPVAPHRGVRTFEDRLQAHAVEQLRDEERRTVCGRSLVVDPHDVAVFVLREHLGLTAEAGFDLGRAEQAVMQQLDGDVAAEPFVVRAKHHADGALADALDEAVALREHAPARIVDGCGRAGGAVVQTREIGPQSERVAHERQDVRMRRAQRVDVDGFARSPQLECAREMLGDEIFVGAHCGPPASPRCRSRSRSRASAVWNAFRAASGDG